MNDRLEYRRSLGLPGDQPITNYAELEAALIEIKSWCEDILNADRGEVDFSLREFAGDVYGKVCDTIGAQP